MPKGTVNYKCVCVFFQVLIKMSAAGVNPVETYIVSGTYALKPSLPFTPGGDGAGIINQVGSEVKHFKVSKMINRSIFMPNS